MCQCRRTGTEGRLHRLGNVQRQDGSDHHRLATGPNPLRRRPLLHLPYQAQSALPQVSGTEDGVALGQRCSAGSLGLLDSLDFLDSLDSLDLLELLELIDSPSSFSSIILSHPLPSSSILSISGAAPPVRPRFLPRKSPRCSLSRPDFAPSTP